jgi:pantetheine-phosphate adenylyltransferase
MRKKIAVAGSFNLIHKGHEKLLARAFEAGEEIYIGLTSDELARADRDVEVQSFETRKKNLIEVALKFSGGKMFNIVEISDPLGPAVSDDYDAIVVSKETTGRAETINEVRAEKGLEPLEIIAIDMVAASDGKPITSTRVIRNEIDTNGNPIS